MSLNVAQKPKANLGRVEAGTYPARPVQIIDLGQQVQTDWQTGEPKTYDDGNIVVKPEVFINFEFPTERVTVQDEDRPRWTGKQYTLSNHEKAALTQLLNAAAPGTENVSEVLAKPVTVTVGSTSGGNAKITNVAPIMKGMAVAELENPTAVFDFDEPDMEVFNKLPEWIRNKIQTAENFSGSALSKLIGQDKAIEATADAASAATDPAFEDMDDEIPF
jgi:hypothetical protein